MEITSSLHGDDSPCEVTGIPLELAREQDPIWIVGPIMFSAKLFQDTVSGSTYINMMTCSMSLMGLGVTPLVGDHSMPALLGEEDTDFNQVPLPSSDYSPFIGSCAYSPGSVLNCFPLAVVHP